ncbi:MAG: ankyrin repeat domain-containing protein, partial [Phycisphaerales bacterium]|nr:ankyrin repeat domain-containing protein [Phycisphaerales bacterium]
MASITIIVLLQGCRGEQAQSPEPPATPTPTTRPTSEPPIPAKVPQALVPLKLNIPKLLFHGPMYLPYAEPNVEKLPDYREPHRPVFMVPDGAVNLASYRPVTSNESLPVIGELEMVTDNIINVEDGYSVNIGFGRKWVQIDLEQCAPLCAIVIWRPWHGGREYRVYRDVIVQVSNDPEFNRDVRTLFNNDHDNSSAMGRGEDRGYAETRYGKIIDAGGVRGRYVRIYSKGSTYNDQNECIEVAVYGLGETKPKPKPRQFVMPPLGPPTSIHQAAERGDTKAVAEFLRKGVSPDAVGGFDQNPLHVAAENNRNEVVKLLLENGAKPDVRDLNDNTPLQLAAERHNIPMIKMLLAGGAGIDFPGHSDATPLFEAVECPDTVRVL